MAINSKKRKADFVKYSDQIGNPAWSVELSNQQILTLAKIVSEYSNNDKRWEALESSNVLTKYTRKGHFKEQIVKRVKMYLDASQAKKNDVYLIRWAIGINLFSNPQNVYEFSNMEEFDKLIEQHLIDRGLGTKKEKTNSDKERLTTSYEKSNSNNTDFAEVIGSIIGYGIFVVPALLIALSFLGAFNDSPEEIEEKKNKMFNECVTNLGLNISRSCELDPVTSYCGLNYDTNDILGSGCTSRVKRQGSREKQVEFCKDSSLKDVKLMCFNEVYD